MYYYECRAIEVSLSAIILTLNAFECRAEWETCAAKQHNFRTLFYGWNSVRKFGRLRGTYVELRATQSTV